MIQKNSSSAVLKQTIAKIEGAYAPATIRAYKSNFESFIKFCDEKNQPSFPATSDQVADYIRTLSDGHLKSASIRIAIAAISAIHRLNDLLDPTQHSAVKIEMRRMFRSLGRQAKQAHGINKPLLNKMIEATGQNLRGIRDRALINVAYDTMCRRSELTSLRIEDIFYTENKMCIRLRKSKTDPHGIGKVLYIGHESEKYLADWLEELDCDEGYIFRGIKGKRIQQSLSDAQINRIYKYIAKKASVDHNIAEKISGHSMRVGAAQDLLTTGSTLAAIMIKGRWSKTDTVTRYLENAYLA